MSILLKWEEITVSQEKGVNNSFKISDHAYFFLSYHIHGVAYSHILQKLILLNYKIFLHKRHPKLLEF